MWVHLPGVLWGAHCARGEGNVARNIIRSLRNALHAISCVGLDKWKRLCAGDTYKYFVANSSCAAYYLDNVEGCLARFDEQHEGGSIALSLKYMVTV